MRVSSLLSSYKIREDDVYRRHRGNATNYAIKLHVAKWTLGTRKYKHNLNIKYSEMACCRSQQWLSAAPLSRTGAKPLLHRIYARFHTLLSFTIKGKQLSKQTIALDKHKLQHHHHSSHSLIHCLSSKEVKLLWLLLFYTLFISSPHWLQYVNWKQAIARHLYVVGGTSWLSFNSFTESIRGVSPFDKDGRSNLRALNTKLDRYL